MALEKHALLIDRLTDRTGKAQVEWKQSVVDSAFQVSFGENTLRMREIARQESSECDYFLDLINADGAVVESVSDVELDAEARAQGRALQGTATWYSKMRNLYETARRSALGSDKIINDILDHLK